MSFELIATGSFAAAVFGVFGLLLLAAVFANGDFDEQIAYSLFWLFVSILCFTVSLTSIFYTLKPLLIAVGAG